MNGIEYSEFTLEVTSDTHNDSIRYINDEECAEELLNSPCAIDDAQFSAETAPIVVSTERKGNVGEDYESSLAASNNACKPVFVTNYWEQFWKQLLNDFKYDYFIALVSFMLKVIDYYLMGVGVNWFRKYTVEEYNQIKNCKKCSNHPNAPKYKVNVIDMCLLLHEKSNTSEVLLSTFKSKFLIDEYGNEKLAANADFLKTCDTTLISVVD